jgi:broad specificity phosphatase PhoE
MTRLILCRHGETDWNMERCYPALDPDIVRSLDLPDTYRAEIRLDEAHHR